MQAGRWSFQQISLDSTGISDSQMRVCYIWIENFKNFRNFGINLRNDFRFSYDSSTQTLSREMQADFPPEILGDQILDVTAILGINGAGKTSALELICLALKSAERLQSQVIVVYESGDNLCYISTSKSEIYPDFPVLRKSDFKDLKDLNVIYFSNVFDHNQMDLGKYVQDISTNFKYSRRRPFLIDGSEPEIVGQLKFIYSNQFIKINIDAPRYIEIKIDRSIRSISSIRTSKQNELLRRISSVQVNMRKLARYSPGRLASIAIQAQFLYQLLLDAQLNDELVQKIDMALQEPIRDEAGFKVALLVVQDYFSESGSQFRLEYIPDVPKLINTLLNLEFHLIAMNIRMDDSLRSSRYSFTVDFNRHEPHPYLELSWIIEFARGGSVNWIGISSGQRACLNMFSSIWNTLGKAGIAKSHTGGILLCIDEADLYLHPRWQVEFMERLTTCLPELSEQKTQLVITTHSPMLVSDLPSQCLMTLSKPFSTKSTELVTDDVKTFGANLFDIYSSAFDLKGQRTGNISSKYISKILKILDGECISVEQRETLLQAASIIDDQLIKSHIIKRIYSK